MDGKDLYDGVASNLLVVWRNQELGGGGRGWDSDGARAQLGLGMFPSLEDVTCLRVTTMHGLIKL